MTSPSAGNPGHELALRLRAAFTFFRRRSSLEFGKFGVTADQFLLLTSLVTGGGSTQEELVRRLCSDTATVGAMLVLLEKRGLVARKSHSTDGRAWLVEATAEGERLQARLWESSQPLRTRLAALFTSAELETLNTALDRIARAMAPAERRSTRLRKPAAPVSNRSRAASASLPIS